MATANSSQLWTPYRALGFITDAVPFALQQRGTANFVTTVIGTSFQTFNCDKLRLLFVGSPCKKTHGAVACHGEMVFTGTGAHIYGWRRGKHVSTWKGHMAPVVLLYPFGDHLLSLSTDNVLKVWDVEAGETYADISFPPGFTATCVVHPPTYLNKVVVGSAEGTLRLYNVRTQKVVHEFAGWGSPVQCVVASPALDVVGVGLADGRVVVHNLKYDETVLTFTQADGPVTCMAFRTDGPTSLVTGSLSGNLSIWDLDKATLIGTTRKAHDGPVRCMQFLAGHPLMLTSGEDNALKMWIFDSPDGTARLLKGRDGHTMPPSRVRYYGEDAKQLLSAGLDRAFRLFSTIQDAQSRELSQGSIASKAKALDVDAATLKLPTILQFDSATIREKDWDNVVTCHSDDPAAYTWRYDRRARGEHKLLPPSHVPPSPVKTVCVSMCGNFAVTGTLCGRMDKFNMQSGRYRGSFGLKDGHSHTGSVRGVFVDNVNRTLVSAGLDGTVQFWDFYTLKHIATLDVGSPIAELVGHRDSNMVAVACDDLVVRVVDIDTHRIVRRFDGHTNRITDMAFSPDARWLVSASMDGTVRVWDTPSGRCLDWFAVDKAATSVAFSPVGDFLATTHVDSVGVYMWANRDYFSSVFLKRVGEEPLRIALPMAVVTAADRDHLSDDDSGSGSEESSDGDAVTSDLPGRPTQVDELVTTSELPASAWQNLSHLDLIKERNKPIEAPKAPVQAPFFLPTTAALDPTFVPVKEGDEDDKPQSRILDFGAMSGKSAFVLMLEKGQASGDYDPVTEHLKTLGPSAIDSAFRALAPEEYELAVDYFCSQMGTNRNYEVVQAYLNLFLKLHGDAMGEQDEFSATLSTLAKVQSEGWEALAALFQSDICLVKYLRGAVA